MRGKFPGSSVIRYASAVIAVAAAATLTHFLTTLGDAGLSPLFFAAVLFSAWFGGLGPGLAATFLSGVATTYLLIPHINSFVGIRDAVLRVLVFTVVAILTSSLHAATRRAAAASRLVADAFRKARDAAEEASAAKTRFLATVSHELRTPLSSVVMIGEAIAKDVSLPRLVRDDAEAILRCVELEVRLIDDLVDLSRIGHGKLSLNMQPLDLHQSLLATLQLCDSDLKEKQIELITEFKAAKSQVIADGVRLQQIFWNLIRNALKFTPDAGRIGIVTRTDAEERIIVEVSDNGIGIDPQRLSSIFEAFEQAGPDITARFGGLGLGLAICQALVEAHGGTIRAFSHGLNQGSVFSVAIPSAPGTGSRDCHSTLAVERITLP
jgi:signal transduction histidine kinase